MADKDLFEPDKEQQAAAVCGLSVDEHRELVELQKKSYGARTRAERERGHELDPDHRLPPLPAEQAAIVHGLTVEEYRELEALEKVGAPHRAWGIDPRAATGPASTYTAARPDARVLVRRAPVGRMTVPLPALWSPASLTPSALTPTGG